MKNLLVLLLALLLPLSACAGTRLFAVNVGKGDALLLMGEGYTCLIDTASKDREDGVRAALDRFGITHLDAVFITHTDKDHAGGLKWLDGFPVDALYASSYHTMKGDAKHPAVKAAGRMGLALQWLKAGDELPLSDAARLRVLAPETPLPDENDNSLVMMLECPDGRILFTGDMELDQEALLLASGNDLSCHVLKVPNHGDDDACSRSLIDACSAAYALISTSSFDKPDTPSPRVLQDLRDAGCTVCCTQDSDLGILFTLRGGDVYPDIL